jgi:thiol-disulfide isomerase/thioredoxin
MRTILFALLAVLSPAFAIAGVEPAQQAAAATAAQQQAAAAAGQGYHVVMLHDSDTTKATDLMDVLTKKLGATEEKAQTMIERVGQKGKAVVVAGSKDSCDEAAQLFEAIGMKTEVRPLSAEDMPSVYDDSDVIVAGAAGLTALIESEDAGFLVVFYAPWCGPCKQIVPAVKEAATELKADGIKVAAVDGQMNGQVAQQLGVRAFPAIKWLKREEQNGEKVLAVADYEGGRDSGSFVRFCKAAHKAGALRSKLGATERTPAPDASEKDSAETAAKVDQTADAAPAATSAPPKSKLAQSKVGGAGASVGIKKAQMPAEAEGEPKAAA